MAIRETLRGPSDNNWVSPKGSTEAGFRAFRAGLNTLKEARADRDKPRARVAEGLARELVSTMPRRHQDRLTAAVDRYAYKPVKVE